MGNLNANAATEEDRVALAVDGVPPDHQLIRAIQPSWTIKEITECARDMVRSLFVMDCEFYRAMRDGERIVAEGWFARPAVVATYVSPPRVVEEIGMAYDLTPLDRQRLRQIVRKTHRRLFREPPTDAQCDDLINCLGPVVAAKMVKRAIDAGKID